MDQSQVNTRLLRSDRATWPAAASRFRRTSSSLRREVGQRSNLNPQYSPEAGLSEWGLGWRPARLSLQRWRPAGDLDYVTDDLTGPWGHLVRGSDGAWYAAGLQSLVRVEAAGAGFVARLPNGSQWVFDRRVDTASGTYAWYVTSIVSAAGRRTELRYLANSSGRLFLSQVLYGASPSRPMQYEVDYEYESLPQTFSDYRSGMALVLDRRVLVARMNVLVDGAMKERWSYSIGYQNDGFAYQGSVVGQAFLLTRVQRTFASGATEPAVTYAYSSAAERLATTSFRPVPKLAAAITQNGPTVFQANRAALVDVDLDGRVDFENAVDGTVYRQTDDTYILEPMPQPVPADAIGRCRPVPSYSNPPRRLAELRVARNPGEEPQQVVTMINSAVNTAFTVCNRAGQVVYSQSIPYGWNFGPNLRLADLNRDSQPDLIRVYSGGYQTIANVSSIAGFAFGPGTPRHPHARGNSEHHLATGHERRLGRRSRGAQRDRSGRVARKGQLSVRVFGKHVSAFLEIRSSGRQLVRLRAHLSRREQGRVDRPAPSDHRFRIPLREHGLQLPAGRRSWARVRELDDDARRARGPGRLWRHRAGAGEGGRGLLAGARRSGYGPAADPPTMERAASFASPTVEARLRQGAAIERRCSLR